MRFALAFVVAILAVAGARAQSPPVSSAPPLGDGLEDWCAQVKLPSNIAICSDPELRSILIERQHAFEEARSRLNPDQQKALLADQNAWVRSYPQGCGLSQSAPPSLPLAPIVKDCMAQAGRARIAYLRGYEGAPAPAGHSPPPSVAATPSGTQIGPSFDCAKATQPLASMICASPMLSELDLRFVQAYQALRYQVGPDAQQQLRQEAIDFQQSVLQTCGVPETGPVSGSPDCVAAQYDRQRALWVSRLQGQAYEEATRPIGQHVALQAQLQKLGFLPAAAKVDGIYGDATRSAIIAWQHANGRPETGFLGDVDATVLQPIAEVPPPAPPIEAPPPGAPEGAGSFDHVVAPPSAQLPEAQPNEQGTQTEAQPTQQGERTSTSDTVIGLLIFVAALYFLPALIASGRHHHNAMAIFALNLLLGWTALGWIAALVWSLTAVNRSREGSG